MVAADHCSNRALYAGKTASWLLSHCWHKILDTDSRRCLLWLIVGALGRKDMEEEFGRGWLLPVRWPGAECKSWGWVGGGAVFLGPVTIPNQALSPSSMFSYGAPKIQLPSESPASEHMRLLGGILDLGHNGGQLRVRRKLVWRRSSEGPQNSHATSKGPRSSNRVDGQKAGEGETSSFLGP